MNKILKIIFFVILALNKSYAQGDVPTANVGEQAMISSLREAISTHPQLKSHKIILGAGMSGCEAFSYPTEKKEIHVLLTWQWLDPMKDLAKGTVVVMPEHAIDERFNAIKNNVKLITITGVLHTKTLENIVKESSSVIDPSTESIVMLAGDTQQENGQWILYNEKMVTEFLKIMPTTKKTLILNGPRTGKHIMQDKAPLADETAHRTTTDYITQLVIEGAMDKPWNVVDFKFGQASFWGPSLKFCVENPKVILIIPGESTSMISESLTLGIKPIVYVHSAITPTSVRYIKLLNKEDKILIYPNFQSEKGYRQQPVANQYDKILQALDHIISGL